MKQKIASIFRCIWKGFKLIFLNKIAWVIYGVIIIAAAPIIISQNHIWYSFTNTGQIGDTIGGITAPIVGTLGAILVYLALEEQIKANKLITKQFEVQKKITTGQNFEQTFFNMLNIQQNIVTNMKLDTQEFLKFANEFPVNERQDVEKSVSDIISSYKAGTILQGSDIFKCASQILSSIVVKKELSKIIESVVSDEHNSDEDEVIFDAFTQVYIKLFELLDIHLGHYYRNLYRIVKMIDEQDFLIEDESQKFNKKYSYTAIVRAQMSDYEIEFSFYNGLYEYGRKFKPLIEKYTLLKILNGSQNPVIQALRGRYDKGAFQKSEDTKKEETY